MSDALNRRQFLHRTGLSAGLAAGAAAGAGCAPGRGGDGAAAASPADRPVRHPYQDGLSPWPICLDTSTIRPASLDEKVRIISETGWDGLEVWERELTEYEGEGGDLKELGDKLRDLGLRVPNVIALWQAFPPTDEEFEANIDTQRERMRQAMEVGADHVQVVGVPARPWERFDLARAAGQYRRYLEIGLDDYNVRPAVMFLQFLPHLQRMGQAAAIAIDADHPDAAVIPDVFHLYSGGTGFAGLKHLAGDFIAVFQINDVPEDPPRQELEDRHRVFPGDGILPLGEALRDVRANGFDGAVTLQLFDESLWERRDLTDIAREGREKTVRVVAEAVGAA